MEGLKGLIIDKLEAAKPYAIVAGIAYVAGILTHWIV